MRSGEALGTSPSVAWSVAVSSGPSVLAPSLPGLGSARPRDPGTEEAATACPQQWAPLGREVLVGVQGSPRPAARGREGCWGAAAVSVPLRVAPAPSSGEDCECPRSAGGESEA